MGERGKFQGDNIVEAMVKSRIATKEEDKFILTRPEYLVYVAETGCNTNQVKDNRVGGELFVLPNGEPEVGPGGVTNDIHFTVLGSVLGTGEPLMCAVIFKSDQHIRRIPMNWMLGINQSLVSGTVATDNTISDEETHRVMSGGPACVTNGKTVPCFYGASPNASITSEMFAEMWAEMLKHIDT